MCLSEGYILKDNQICYHFSVHRGHEADVNAVVSIYIKGLQCIFCFVNYVLTI